MLLRVKLMSYLYVVLKKWTCLFLAAKQKNKKSKAAHKKVKQKKMKRKCPGTGNKGSSALLKNSGSQEQVRELSCRRMPPGCLSFTRASGSAQWCREAGTAHLGFSRGLYNAADSDHCFLPLGIGCSTHFQPLWFPCWPKIRVHQPFGLWVLGRHYL